MSLQEQTRDPSCGLPSSAPCRATLVLVAFLLWGALIVGRLAQFTIVQRDGFLAQMAREAVVERTIPAVRGRILDRDGRLLAWSTRHFALRWRVPRDPARARSDLVRIHARLPAIPNWHEGAVVHCVGQEIMLTAELTVAECSVALVLGREVPGLRLKSYFQRHRCSTPGIGELLGKVRIVDGVEIGISGAEKAHDALLRGRSAKYRVLRDKRGRWVPETWQTVHDMRPGCDVHLPARVGADSTDTT